MKECAYCKQPVIGRSDKIFCDVECKTAYHNASHQQQEKMIRAVNRRIRQNRSILRLLCPIGKATVKRTVLESKGFSFTYFTSIYQSKTATYFFCYEYGYAPLPNKKWKGTDKVMIIQKQDYMNSKSDSWSIIDAPKHR